MKTFVCVYRHPLPKEQDRRKTLRFAEETGDADLREFVEGYSDRFQFFDWGDDPSFFAAERLQGDVRHATWGVCRPNVRERLSRGDLVVFFCARQHSERDDWDYFYTGFGTVDQLVKPRKELWTKRRYAQYRRYYNILGEFRRGVLSHRESFYPHHKDWLSRLKAPYVLFATDPNLTDFNLCNPLHVATATPSQNAEIWNRDGRQLERLLFPNSVTRRLRTSRTGSAHPHIKLSMANDSALVSLRRSLLRLSRSIARR